LIAYRLVHTFALQQSGDPLRTSGATGRWNSKGVRVTYLAEHPALAALEILNYVGMYRSVQGYQLYRVELPDAQIQIAPSTIDVHDYSQTRPYGDDWIRRGESLALRVPSVTGPDSFNVLLNQLHPALPGLQPEFLGPYHFDDRVAALIER
jgi:RES domain-containing protein